MVPRPFLIGNFHPWAAGRMSVSQQIGARLARFYLSVIVRPVAKPRTHNTSSTTAAILITGAPSECLLAIDFPEFVSEPKIDYQATLKST
jgi:hypothetical protein